MNIQKIRKDFPIIDEITYLDNACMTLKPDSVINAVNEYYESYPICGGGRSQNELAEKLDRKIRESRTMVKEMINARNTDEIIFTQNTSEAINMIARGLNFNKGETVLTTDKEHNSNLAPWITLEEEEGIDYKQIPFKKDGTLNIEKLKEEMNENVKLVSMVHTSNLDGTTIQAKEVSKIVKENGSYFHLDAAQSVPHRPIDVRDLDVDFLTFSVHKMLGPTGVGVLYSKKELLKELSPLLVGGGNVKDSTYNSINLHEPPKQFECGLQNYAGLCGVKEALEYVKEIGLNEIKSHEEKLNSLITKEIGEKVEIIGPNNPKKRSGIFTFWTQKSNSYDISSKLDSQKIITRPGQHCVYSWYNSHSIKGGVRISFYIYNTEEEVMKTVEAINDFL